MSNFQRTSRTFSDIFDTFTRATDATYFGPGNVLQTVGANVPRFTPTGLLLEKSTTNLVLHNRDLSQADWLSASVPETKTQTETGIDGVANTAWFLEDASIVARRVITQIITVPDDSVSRVVSLFVKKTTGATIFPVLSLQYRLGSYVPDLRYAMNTNDGTLTKLSVSTGNDSGTKVTDRGDYWRFEVVITNDSTGNTQLHLSIYPAASDGTAGSFEQSMIGSCVVDYIQVEDAKLVATSPILTGASTVARNEEVCSDGTISDWFDGTEFSIYGELEPQTNENDNVQLTFWSLSSGSSGNRCEFRFDNGVDEDKVQLALRVGNLNVQFANFDESDNYKFAISFDSVTGTAHFSVNGVTTTITSDQLEAALAATSLRLNTRYNGASAYRTLGATFKKFNFIQRALAAGEIQALTN